MRNAIPADVVPAVAAGATFSTAGSGSLNMSGNAQEHIADHLILADLQLTGNGGAFFDVSGIALIPDGVDYCFANY